MTRGELDRELADAFGDAPDKQVHQGLAKLLEDRCEFEVVSGQPPELLRLEVFALACGRRQTGNSGQQDQDTKTQGDKETGRQGDRENDSLSLSPCLAVPLPSLNRSAILQEAARRLNLTPEAVEQGLFADLKSEQRLVGFKDTTAERLVQRYNVALAQAVVLRATAMQVLIRGEPPQRWRQLLRLVKFHRLVGEVEPGGAEAWCLRLDGPLSLFRATQKYGLQLALFLPAVLRCRDFELEAELRWGPQRRPRRFTLSSADGLVSDYRDSGTYVPADLGMFLELFRKKVVDWEISELADLLPLGGTLWAPDYRLTHRPSGKVVYLDVLGFWRRSSALKHLERLRHHAAHPFVLAVSEQLRVDETELDGLPTGVHRFRQMPLPDEVARLAQEALLLADDR
jgi:predicted nuclease of restriction endonuclease-like RecB superfamily